MGGHRDVMKGKWTVLAFLCGVFVLYTVDRALLGILAIPIQKETGLNDVQFGVLSSAIFWTYALVVPFAGLAGDRFDRAKLIGLAVIAWSLMTFLAGFAGGFWSLFLLVSFAIVVPQTVYSPTAHALIASLHKETRTVAMSCHQAAYYTGWFVSGAAVAGILALFGTWRAAFFVCGGLGLLVGLVFLLFAARMAPGSPAAIEQSNNPNNRTIEQSNDRTIEQSEQSNNPNNRTIKQSLRAFWGCPSALLAGLAYVAEVFVGFGYSAWGPKFVAVKFGISPGAAGTGVMFWHYAASFAAILVTGVVTDRLVRKHPRFRLVLSMAAMAVCIPALVLFGFADLLPVVWLAAALFGVMRGVFGANQFTNVFDVVPAANRAAALGFLNVVAGLVGSLAPILIGWLSHTRGVRGFEIGFAAMGAIQVVAIGTLLWSYLFTFERNRLKEG